jgi:predicted outer membrane repeat protein
MLDGDWSSDVCSSDLSVTNCTFFENSAYYSGGGIDNNSSSPTVTNCTFFGNQAANDGGAIRNTDSSPTVINCILWADLGKSGYDEIFDNNSTPTVTYSDVMNGYTGTGNINSIPLFVDAANGDLRLSDGSPCKDAGNNAAIPDDLADLDGDGIIDEQTPYDLDYEIRVSNTVVDMGAYEF